MAYKLQLKRGASGSLPTGSAGEPLFTTDTNDLYIGTGAANQRFQKYIASGTSAQFLKGDGSLDSTTYTPTSRTLTINGTSLDLSANRTFNVGTVTTAAATTGGQVAFFNGATVITSVSGLYFDGVDKLGIGNSSPAYNLDVTGTARMTGNLTAASLIKSGGTSSQYLMADGSTSTLTNPVTGTGTTNYLPKWTSGSAIGNSLVYDSGTAIGIGTSSPSTLFYVNGYTASNWITTLNNTGTSGHQLYFGYNDGSSTQYGLYIAGGQGSGSGNFDFGIGNSKFRVMSGGNVLINSSTDNGNRLQVTGNGYFSGSLGVGTSTPAGKLTVADSVNNGTANVLYLSNTSQTGVTSAAINFINIDGVIKSSIIGAVYGNDYMTFNVGSNTERMRISASGNLGLGVVPSAWSVSGIIQISNTDGTKSYASSGVYNALSSNAYYNSGWKYATTGNSLFYSLESDKHVWYNSISGTAGNAITFISAMTLTASGRLLLGTTTEGTYAFTINDISGGNLLKITSGSTILDYYVSGGNPSFGTASNHDLRIKTNDVTRLTIASTGAATFSSSVTAGTPYVSFHSFNARGKIFLDDSTRRYVTLGMDSNVATINCDWYSGAGGDNPDFAIKTGGSERMRITSGGNVGIGTTSPQDKLTVKSATNYNINLGLLGSFSGIYVYNDAASAYKELRIDAAPLFLQTYSGSNVLIGTTTDSGERLQVSGSSKLNGNTIIGSATTADVFSRGYSGRILGISASGQSAIELNSSTGNGAYFDMGVNGSRTFGIYSDTTNSDISTTGAYPLLLSTNSVPRLTIKTNGSINYTPMATPASAVAGDVYYDSTSNKLRCYNGTSWNDLF